MGYICIIGEQEGANYVLNAGATGGRACVKLPKTQGGNSFSKAGNSKLDNNDSLKIILTSINS